MSPMPPDTASQIEAIIRQALRLTPSWQRPELFHEQKSELVDQLRALARSPLMTRTVVRFVAIAPPPVVQSPPTPHAVQHAPRRTRRPVRRHCYPRPPRQVPGQVVLVLDSA
jgi:hypothetical protein